MEDSRGTGVDIRERGSDVRQDVARGGLYVQGGSLVSVAGLEFGEQPHVLNRDDGLIGEGLDERDLLVGERLYLTTPYRDGSERRPLPQHRHGQERSVASGKTLVLGVDCDIVKMDHVPLEYGAAPPRLSPRTPREPLPKELEGLGPIAVGRRDVEDLPIESSYPTNGRVTQPGGTTRDRVKHRLGVGRRAGDHSQDLTGRRLLLRRLVRRVE